MMVPPRSTSNGEGRIGACDGEGENRIGALPDDVLLQIIGRLDQRTAVQASVLSRQWMHLPHQRSRLVMQAADFRKPGRSVDQVMAAYTDATLRLLSPLACNCLRTMKTLRLSFYLREPCMSSIGHAVGDVVKTGETEYLELAIYAEVEHPSDAQLALFGQRFMSFFRACPSAFSCLTKLTLKNVAFQDSDVNNLLTTCNKLRLLSLRSCEMVHASAVLEIDAPCSDLRALQLVSFGCVQVKLTRLPKLTQLLYDLWHGENPPVYFGYVPQLRQVCFSSPAVEGQTPFALSQCLSTSNTNLSVLNFNFRTQMIWIEPEHPRQLIPIFRKLRDVHLYNIFAECDLNWTLFILQGAPLLENFYLSRHTCKLNKYEDSAEKSNVVSETSDFKHLNLKLLLMRGFEEEEKVMNYIRLVMERAVGLRRIELPDKIPCKTCNAVNLESPGFPVDEHSKHRIREKLSGGLFSSAEIIIG